MNRNKSEKVEQIQRKLNNLRKLLSYLTEKVQASEGYEQLIENEKESINNTRDQMEIIVEFMERNTLSELKKWCEK